MFKRVIATLILAIAGANLVSATTYYVSTGGKDSNNGSQASPWLTVSKAASTAVAGDVVNIAPGSYSGAVTFNNSGSAGNPITFAGSGSVIIVGNVTLQGNYVTLSGVTDSPPSAGGYNAITVNGNNDVLSSVNVVNYGATAGDQATAIGIGGSYDTIANCTIGPLNDIDAFHLWGHNNLIIGCVVTNLNQVNYSQNHTDFIQSWGPGTCYSNTVMNCLCVNSTCQSGNLSNDGSVTSGAAGMHDLYFINCVWANVQNPLFCGIPRTLFYNCVFYKTAQNSGSGDSPIVFYGITAYSSAGSSVVNSVFLDCGSSPSNPQYGGIGADGFDLSTITIDHNYFGGTGYAAKNGAYLGSNPINGGQTKFVNEAGYDFHLSSGSVLIGAGVNLSPMATVDKGGNTRPASGAWDLGNYQFSTTGGGSTTPNLTLSPISQNAADVDASTSGVQIYEGTTVQYSATATETATNVVSWQWSYSINGGASVLFQSGTGTVPAVSFNYPSGTGGKTYVWTLSATDGVNTGNSTLTMSVEVPPVAGTGLTFQAPSGTLTSPMAVSGAYISQAVQTTTVATSGKATYNFSITNAGNYVIQALVNAPSDSANSMYVNIDAQPVDPTAIWDIVITSGFENRIISWRGTGTDTSNQFVPKVFNLTAGAHQIIFGGREAGVQLQSFSVLQLPGSPQNLRVLSGVATGAPTFSAGP